MSRGRARYHSACVNKVQVVTGAFTLAQTLSGDPPLVRAVERKSYTSGYHLAFTNQYARAVLAAVATYTTRHATHLIATSWAATTPSKLHATQIPTPSGAPGHAFWLWRGTVTRAGHQIPMYTAQWTHGTAICVVSIVGNGAAPASLMTLVRTQDHKLASDTT